MTLIDGADPLVAIATTVVVAIAYLVVLRLVDLNEREPLWSLGLFVGSGFVIGLLLHLLVPSTTLQGGVWRGALLGELATAAAIAIGVGVLQAIARLRGFHELSGVTDGLVYGFAAGLGTVLGATLVTGLTVGPYAAVAGGVGARLWPLALGGLAVGTFGALTGAGVGLASQRRQPGLWFLGPAAGLVLAVLAHGLHTLLRTGNALGDSGRTLLWVSLLLPVAAVAALVAWALQREREAIVTGLSDEPQDVVTAEDYHLLTHVGARRQHYLRLLMAGDVAGWATARETHTRLVQLALAEYRLARASEGNREELASEVAQLRALVRSLRASSATNVEVTA